MKESAVNPRDRNASTGAQDWVPAGNFSQSSQINSKGVVSRLYLDGRFHCREGLYPRSRTICLVSVSKFSNGINLLYGYDGIMVSKASCKSLFVGAEVGLVENVDSNAYSAGQFKSNGSTSHNGWIQHACAAAICCSGVRSI